MISLYDKLQNSGETIKSIFKNASIMETIDNTGFQMRIHFSTYQNRNIFYQKRNYLNYLNCKSYGIHFFFHFSCWIFSPLTIRSKIRSKNIRIFSIRKFLVQNFLQFFAMYSEACVIMVYSEHKYIQNPRIFRKRCIFITLEYSEAKAYSGPC